MAEELFEFVTFATAKISRTSGVVSSRQGDNLEGNILACVGKRYLINVFQKLTLTYFRYGKHRLSDEEFEAAKFEYQYKPRRAPFEIQACSKRSVHLVATQLDNI